MGWTGARAHTGCALSSLCMQEWSWQQNEVLSMTVVEGRDMGDSKQLSHWRCFPALPCPAMMRPFLRASQGGDSDFENPWRPPAAFQRTPASHQAGALHLIPTDGAGTGARAETCTHRGSKRTDSGPWDVGRDARGPAVPPANEPSHSHRVPEASLLTQWCPCSMRKEKLLEEARGHQSLGARTERGETQTPVAQPPRPHTTDSPAIHRLTSGRGTEDSSGLDAGALVPWGWKNRLDPAQPCLSDPIDSTCSHSHGKPRGPQEVVVGLNKKCCAERGKRSHATRPARWPQCWEPQCHQVILRQVVRTGPAHRRGALTCG